MHVIDPGTGLLLIIAVPAIRVFCFIAREIRRETWVLGTTGA